MNKKDYLIYPAIFDDTNNNGQGYTVTFPDVPDTVSQGKTLEEAFKNAPYALAVALPDYDPYPTPTPIEEVMKDNPGLIVNYVGIDLKIVRKYAKDTTVRKNVTIPQSLAKWAEEQHINFSQALTDTLEYMRAG
ncbi:type II toxin-antitoxin system HicB family antitoxin [Xylocopilactobacillus apicola]|uniref:Antitoxin HicB n=1 Tax=Xylocopilactobacillus apicola TaxID=2932184 RepID=A0AAU9DAR7_9LACO|nr:type II toxin-antitoxin system HicB family antitoxin [Xylocopilactobacillus apicola]BDR59561.1 antitoxin HicB [Xylocopilactobacillus apicola]